MKPTEAGEILSGLADSLRANPDQFNYVVNVNVGSITGLRASASAPGATGMSVVMGAGSSGTGVHVQAGIQQADIEFAEAAAGEAARAVVQEAADIIESIADDLADDGDRGKIQQTLERLAELSIPACISAAVAAVIQLVLST